MDQPLSMDAYQEIVESVETLLPPDLLPRDVELVCESGGVPGQGGGNHHAGSALLQGRQLREVATLDNLQQGSRLRPGEKLVNSMKTLACHPHRTLFQ